MDELIVDWNTIEVSTEPTSSISIVIVQFHLQHSNTARGCDKLL